MSGVRDPPCAHFNSGFSGVMVFMGTPTYVINLADPNEQSFWALLVLGGRGPLPAPRGLRLVRESGVRVPAACSAPGTGAERGGEAGGYLVC